MERQATDKEATALNGGKKYHEKKEGNSVGEQHARNPLKNVQPADWLRSPVRRALAFFGPGGSKSCEGLEQDRHPPSRRVGG